MVDDKGRQVKEAGPSVPVEVLGLVGRARRPATTLTVVENEARAREVAAYRQGVLDREAHRPPRRSASRTCSRTMHRRPIEFPLVVKADVQGSVEAIVNALNKLSTDEIKVRVLHSGVGAITESDVTLAGRERRADHRLQRPPERQGARGRRAQQGRVPLLRRHLPPHRLGEGRDGRRARPGDHRDGRRPRRGQGSLPGRQAATRPPACSSSKASSARASTRASRARTSSSRRRRSPRCGASRTTSPKSAPASSAACCWPTPTTSSRATTSKCSRSRSARGRFESRRA